MKSAKTKWTKATVSLLVSKCATKTDFFTAHRGAYKWAQKNGFLKEICQHMTPPLRTPKWSYEKVILIAKQYSTRTEFRKQAGGAASWATTNERLDQVCAHMKNVVKYDLDTVKTIAKQYTSRGDFAKKAASAYDWAKRNGNLDEVCSHMKIIRNYWTLDAVKEKALLFDSRSEFGKNYPGAHEWATREGVLEEVCAHMHVIGHRYKRALYVYEFENGSVYIGLTYNYKSRNLEHHTRGPVFKEMKKVDVTSYIRLNEWMDPEEAQKAEILLIEKYYAEGWNVLNIAKGGSLGGCTITWDLDATIKEGLKYKTKKEFREKSPSAYVTACRFGMEKVCPHLNNLRKSWDWDSIRKEGLRYKTKKEFSENSVVAYGLAVKIGIDEVCPHMTNLRKSWDFEGVKKVALEFETRADFQRGAQSAYVWAQRNKKLDVICANMKNGRKKDKKWTYENVMQKAAEFNNMREFKKKCPGGYNWVLKNKKLLEVNEKIFSKIENSELKRLQAFLSNKAEESFSSKELLSIVFNLPSNMVSRSDELRIAKLLTSLGWKAKRVTKNGNISKRYFQSKTLP